MNRYISISFFIFISIQNLLAQSHSFEQLTTLDGLPSNFVYNILTDQKGYTWLATDRGVAKYDGHNIKTFTTKDGLTSNDIWRLYEDSQNRIWLSSFTKEIMYIDNDEVKIAGEKENISIYTHYMESDGIVYTVNDATVLYKYEEDKVGKTKLPLPFLPYYRNFALSDLKTIHIGVDSFFLIDHRTQPPSIESFEVPWKFSFLHKPIYSLIVIGNIIFFHYPETDLLYRWNYIKNTVFSYPITPIWGQNIDHCVLKQNQEGFQLSTNLGHAIFDENLNLLSTYTIKGLALGIYSDCSYQSQNRDIFITRKGEGVYILPHQKQHCIQYNVSDKNINIQCIVPYADNRLLLGMADGSIYEKDEDRIFKKIPSAPHHDNKVIDIYPIDEQLWAIKRREIILYDTMGRRLEPPNPHFTFNELADSFKYNVFLNTELRPDFEKNLFLPNNTKGVYYHPSLKWFSLASGQYSLVIDLSDPSQYHLSYYENLRQYATVITNDGLIWYGGPLGLNYIYRDSLHDLKENHPLYSKKVDKLLLDDHQNLWVGTDGYGLYCYQEDHPIEVKGCENDIIIAMALDQNNGIWLSTNHGVKHVIMKDGLPETATIQEVYTTADGLSVDSPSAIYVTDSVLYAGSHKGLDELNFRAFERDAAAPLLYLTQILVNDSIVKDSSFFSLSSNKNNIKINFSGISYKSKRGLLYRYFLDQHTADTLSTNDNFINFTNLPPGDYRLTLYAEDETGLRSEALFRTFHIGKHWYQTAGAFLFYFIAFGASLHLVFRYYQLKAIEKEDIKRRMAELELQALQSQMNPHFIFNALNAIRQYQIENDVESADKYFNGFATLMRLYLESSKKPMISLEDELKLLHLYIGLEELRFDNKFESIIEVDENLEPRYINIPSMFLQPFVENAINHGLFHKQEKGFLQIHVFEKNDSVHISICDDGIGREAAGKIQENSFNNYKSRALQITEERISVLKKQKDVNVDIKIIDLFDEHKNGVGTKVEIVIHGV